MTRKLILLVVLGTLPVICSASNITLQGNFTADDNVQLFSVALATPAAVDFRSYGYAGGTTSTGTTVPRGGFDTILTLFTGSGVFINDNDDGAGVATDPATGLMGDARITANLAAGSYTLALTQYDNFSIGNLSDGFVETGKPNFTADPAFTSGGPCPGNMFRDISGTAGRCRDGNWAVDFVNVASVTPVAPIPEPAAAALIGAGLLGLALTVRRKRGAAIMIPVLLAAALSTSAHAQAPDYGNVNDFLNGKRTLLTIDDLVISGTTLAGGLSLQLNTFTLPSANSQLNTATSLNSTTISFDAVTPLTSHILNPTSAAPLELLSGATTYVPAIYFPTLGKYAATPPLSQPHALSLAGGVVADFNHDGLDEVVLNYSDGTTVVGTNLQVDASGSAALTYGPLCALDALADMTVGDFNGDGQPDIAGLLTLPSGGLAVAIYTVDPNTLAVAKAAQITIQNTVTFEGTPSLSITAGRFVSLGHDQIVVAAGGFVHDNPNGGDWNSYFNLIDFPPSSLTPQQKSNAGAFSVPNPRIKVRAGRFYVPKNLYQQVAYASLGPSQTEDGLGNGYFGQVITIDPITLVWKSQEYATTAIDCAYDMVVGNFDNQQPDPANPGQMEHNLNDQIAVLHGACGNGARVVDIFESNLKTLGLSLASQNTLASSLNNLFGMSMTQSDTQGRSLVLGTPTKITISQPVQPSVVIGAPPMHVDWVSPDPYDGKPAQVLNLSAVPDGFNTTYEVEDTVDQQSGTTNSTSWSFGTKTTPAITFNLATPICPASKWATCPRQRRT